VDWLYSIHDEDDESQRSVINYPHRETKIRACKATTLKDQITKNRNTGIY